MTDSMSNVYERITNIDLKGHLRLPIYTVVRHSKAPLLKFSVPTYYGDIAFFGAHLLGEEKTEFAVR